MYRLREKNSVLKYFTGVRLSLILFGILFIIFIIMLGNISEDTLNRQEESLNAAVSRCIASCYCVEGTYPPSLDYMVEHYGLIYDPAVFFVDYQPMGSNIYPDVTIIRKVVKNE